MLVENEVHLIRERKKLLKLEISIFMGRIKMMKIVYFYGMDGVLYYSNKFLNILYLVID